MGNLGFENPESGKILLVESGILGFGTQNTAQGIRNPTEEWNPESKFHWKRLEYGIHGMGFIMQDGLGFPYTGLKNNTTNRRESTDGQTWRRLKLILFLVTFEITLGRSFCWIWSCNFVVYNASNFPSSIANKGAYLALLTKRKVFATTTATARRTLKQQ